MADVSADGIRARADAAYGELLALVSDAQGLPPLAHLAVLRDLVRASAELRARAERGIGQLLADHPDPGGRPSPCRPTPMGRQLRQRLNLNRTVCSWLVRLAVEVDEQAFAALVDELWAGYPSAGRLSARSIVLGERDTSSDPPPSSDGDSSV